MMDACWGTSSLLRTQGLILNPLLFTILLNYLELGKVIGEVYGYKETELKDVSLYGDVVVIVD